MIIDSHAHTFPFMGAASGFSSPAEHLRRIQRGVYSPINPHSRKRDSSEIGRQTLWNGTDPGPEGLLDVDFRVGRCGRFEWTTGDGDAFVQYFAPSLIDQTSSAEYMVAEMDYAGVGMAVLQNHAIYGILNDFFADCIQQYPSRFIGSAGIREAKADTDEQLSELHRCATSPGMKGLFYQVGGFWEGGYTDHSDDPRYSRFWDEVQHLGLAVLWDPSFGPAATAESYTREMERMLSVLQRRPDIPGMLAQAFPLGLYAATGRYELPDVAFELARLPNFTFEIAYPISYGRSWDYPYRETWPLLHQLYDWFGPERLVWGSDMPNVLRFCTYRQSFEYLRYCDFLNDADLGTLLGGNMARLFGLDAQASPAAVNIDRGEKE
jgi:predicted TIM-barrel fold metal-dependent hydrolase